MPKPTYIPETNLDFIKESKHNEEEEDNSDKQPQNNN